MPYSEMLIKPMREDLTRYGVQETRTPEDVDRLLHENETVLMVVNSVCGCAAGKARPGVGFALRHSVRPDTVATVFAGADEAAVAHVRSLLADYPPSSPSIALFKSGKPVHMIHRSQIEPSDPWQIAKMLTDVFDRYCAKDIATA
jgi:putative YphP/YqiW family bacilliredoxin